VRQLYPRLKSLTLARSTELVKLGQLLRELARTENIAIVVANQVADRFTSIVRGMDSTLVHRDGTTGTFAQPKSVPSPPSTGTPSSICPTDLSLANPTTPQLASYLTDVMTLDHQQRWFTGWGDDPNTSSQKTPSLGLVWTAQIACRIALIKQPIYEADITGDGETQRGEPVLKKWRRWLKVVFAPWTAPSGTGLEGAVEFEITGAGVRAVVKEKR
jgi:DNA repair protein RAD57